MAFEKYIFEFINLLNPHDTSKHHFASLKK